MDKLDKDYQEPSPIKPVLSYIKSYGWMFLPVIILYFLLTTTIDYEKEHPLTCDQYSSVKEILSVGEGGAYAKLLLENGEITNHAFIRGHTKSGGIAYPMKVGDKICLKSSRK
jgi:hypothetical protein